MVNYTGWLSNRMNKINFSHPTDEDYANVDRKKTRMELVLISLVVFGIEICYAAETAFVSPIIQKIGVPIQFMSMVWALSPLIGFFMCPILGSLSDGCRSRLGRRRPFILIYSFGILIGLLLTGYSHVLGELIYDSNGRINPAIIFITVLGVVLLDFDCDACQAPARAYLIDVSTTEDHSIGLSTFTVMAGAGGAFGYVLGGIPWSEFNFGDGSDEYEDDNLEEFKLNLISNNYSTNSTSFEGIYMKSGIAYDHKQLLFTFVAVLYVICAVISITSFKEIPLCSMNRKRKPNSEATSNLKYERMEEDAYDDYEEPTDFQVLKNTNEKNLISLSSNSLNKEQVPTQMETLKYYVSSIFNMPSSLRWLCLTHCLCWMSLLCYSLYFTDFVGEKIYGGLPIDNKNLDQMLHKLYDKGVRAGSFFMAIYSISCSFYSLHLQTLINKFSTKNIYMFSQLIYSVGMFLLALTKSKLTAVFTSLSAGIMYSCLFTIPFILVARYHSNENFGLLTETKQQLNENTNSEFDDENRTNSNNNHKHINNDKRGLGTDLSFVSSMVFIAQFILSFFVGSLIKLIGTKSVVIYLSSILSFAAAITSTKLLYLD